MLITFIVFVLVLGLLIFVHELGHFTAAKLFKVRVDEFALGFPPRIFSVKKGETRYSLNSIPVGGYVSIKGESGDHPEDQDSFANKKIWQRCIILAAGVSMNFITAFVMISIGFIIGLPMATENISGLSSHARVHTGGIGITQVVKDSPAELAGLEAGDIFLSIDNKTFAKTEQISNYVAGLNGAEISLKIKRGSQEISKHVKTRLMGETGKNSMGVSLVETGTVSYPVFFAVWEGMKRTVFITGEILSTFRHLIVGLFTGTSANMAIAGPVGIAVITGHVFRLGFVYLLQFVALLSINLAIINVLPFPALDGGRILFLVIEKIRGKSANQKIEGLIHTLGFSLLMILMLVVTYKDLAKYGGKIIEAVTSVF